MKIMFKHMYLAVSNLRLLSSKNIYYFQGLLFEFFMY